MIHLKRLKKLYPGIEINHRGMRQMRKLFIRESDGNR